MKLIALSFGILVVQLHLFGQRTNDHMVPPTSYFENSCIGGDTCARAYYQVLDEVMVGRASSTPELLIVRMPIYEPESMYYTTEIDGKYYLVYTVMSHLVGAAKTGQRVNYVQHSIEISKRLKDRIANTFRKALLRTRYSTKLATGEITVEYIVTLQDQQQSPGVLNGVIRSPNFATPMDFLVRGIFLMGKAARGSKWHDLDQAPAITELESQLTEIERRVN